jgi:hypothetical protein
MKISLRKEYRVGKDSGINTPDISGARLHCFRQACVFILASVSSKYLLIIDKEQQGQQNPRCQVPTTKFRLIDSFTLVDQIYLVNDYTMDKSWNSPFPYLVE